MPKSAPRATATGGPRIAVRNSPIHGRGVYAARPLAKGDTVIEYKGEFITWKECDRRPPSDPNDPHHTFFFSLSDGKHVIDAAVGGNAARWINHACNPNCETEEDEDGRRVFIKARRNINAGEELNYDYGLIIDERITPTVKKNYECRCGARNCRGTMLALKSKPKTSAATKAKKSAAKDAAANKVAEKKISEKKASSTRTSSKKTRRPPTRRTAE
jgi:hypothetical protein